MITHDIEEAAQILADWCNKPQVIQKLKPSKQKKVTPKISNKPKFGRWSDDEKELFKHLFQIYGKNWEKISQKLRSRTKTQLRTHFQKICKRPTPEWQEIFRKMRFFVLLKEKEKKRLPIKKRLPQKTNKSAKIVYENITCFPVNFLVYINEKHGKELLKIGDKIRQLFEFPDKTFKECDGIVKFVNHMCIIIEWNDSQILRLDEKVPYLLEIHSTDKERLTRAKELDLEVALYLPNQKILTRNWSI